MSANEADKALARWFGLLPMRWALGGFLLGFIWLLISSLLQGSFSNLAGGHVVAIIRAFALIVLPLSILGLAWGWTEQVELKRRLVIGDAPPLQAINGWGLRQTGKAIVCGAFFGAFTYGIGLVRAFQPWDNAEAVVANITSVLGFAVLAAPVGAVVGVVTRRNLRQHLSSIDIQKGTG